MSKNQKNNDRLGPLFKKPLNVRPPEIYGDWSVFRKLSKGRWRARCICGVEKDVVSYSLNYGQSTGCGCRAFQKMAEANKAKLTGKTFGMWHVIEEAAERGNGNQIRWKCRCACGVVKFVHSASLVQGKSKSCGCIKSLGPGEYATRIILRQYQDGAERRGHQWRLSRSQALDLFARPCHYCGLPPSNVCCRPSGCFTYSGIDRLDNSRGYELDNCVPCCTTCNKAKRTMTMTEFKSWLARIFERGITFGSCNGGQGAAA